MSIAGGLFAARRPELLRIGGHEVVRWDDGGRPRLTPLAAGDGRPLAGLVLHTARCGSTQLAHLLASAPGTRVLAEPPLVNLVLGDATLAPAERASLLRRLVATCGAEPGQAPAAVVLKCSSWNVLHAEALRSAFPDTPVVFVLRDPLEVLVSLTERPPRWLVGGTGTGLEERAAIAVAAYLDAAGHHVDHRWLLARYDGLPAAAGTVARHLGVGAPAAGAAATIAGSHVKHPGRPWRDDGPAKRARASDTLRRAHRRHTRPAQERLLAAFAERGAPPDRTATGGDPRGSPPASRVGHHAG